MNKLEQSPRTPEGPPTYSKLLVKYLLEHPHERIQPPEVNMRASRIIISAIGISPQNSGGGYLIADRMMRSFESYPQSSRRIGIPEIAYIIPDAAKCAEVINRFHERFDIPYITPTQAASVVIRFAGFALDNVRMATLITIREQKQDIPEGISDRILKVDDEIKGPWSLNRYASLAVNDYLTTFPQIRKRVAKRIDEQAIGIRSEKVEHLKMAVEKGLKLKAREKKIY